MSVRKSLVPLLLSLVSYVIGRRAGRLRGGRRTSVDITTQVRQVLRDERASAPMADIKRRPKPWNVFLAAVVMVVATAILVHDVGPPSRPPAPDGGLLLLTDRSVRKNPDAASMEVHISPMGFDGLSAMRVVMRFRQPRPGLRWTLVASGQYRIPGDAPEPAYCRFRPERRSSSEVLCPVDVGLEDPAVIYPDREILATSPTGIYGIKDYDGYDAETSSLVRGGLPRYSQADPDYGTVEAAFPIRTPTKATGGSNSYGALAPVAAVNLGDFGLWPEVDSRPISEPGDLLDAVDRTSLNPADISNVQLTMDEDLGYRQVASASPPSVSSDRLQWTAPEIRSQITRYVLHDAAKEGDLLRQTFIGGVLGGLAASLFVWGLELASLRRGLR